MNANKFRPSASGGTKYIMKQRLKYRVTDSYNWQRRGSWYPAGFKLNHKTIFRQFGRLHYLACHSPESVQKKWLAVYNNFYTRHFGTFKGSVRYLNRWSCNAWL